MKLPSKVTPYRESILPLFPDILFILSEGDTSVLGLYNKIKRRHTDLSIGTFIQALDSLYYLEKIQLKEDNLHYVGRSLL